jgi:geranyl-CoA carboxylase alpha subunit
MGDKAESKKRMIAADVPCVPGFQGDQDPKKLESEAARIGYPVMIKASAGGGGRGMRIVTREEDFAAALKTASSEAKNAFGDGTVLLERALSDARHVEIQIFGDAHGNVVHLFERDCSIQRRHQKVVEEAPSPAVSPELRAAMGAAAVRAGKAVNYKGAGTVEFLLDRDGKFYFLEMNTRLQVEHPVTEMITGLDLVALQIDVAEGKELPFDQSQIAHRGHAIEVRLYAEDPAGGFLPQTGPILLWERPCGPGIRVDHGIETGGEVTPFYDPMLAKIVADGRTREEARTRLIRALEETALLGVTTNREFLIDILSRERFAKGEATTAFIGKEFPDGVARNEAGRDEAALLAAALLCDGAGRGWSSSAWLAHPVVLQSDEKKTTYHLSRSANGWKADGHVIRFVQKSANRVRFEKDGIALSAVFVRQDDRIFIDFNGRSFVFDDVTYAPPASADAGGSDGILRAPMNGVVVAMDVAPGTSVKRGQVLATLEAMKMEHPITASVDGVVETAVAKGSQVAARDILIKLKIAE